MNKLKKPVSILILLILSVGILSAFNNSVEIESASSPYAASSQMQNISSIIDNNRSQPYEEKDGKLVIYINDSLMRTTDNISNDFVLVSYTENNVQLLDVSEGELYRSIYNKYPSNTMKNTIFAKNYYDTSTSNYVHIGDNDIIIKYSENTNIPIHKVTYKNYVIDSNVPSNKWVEYYETKLINYNTPVVITESWSIDFDNIHIDIVNASNICINQEESSNYHINTNERFVIYMFSSVFINGDFVGDIGEQLIEKLSINEIENKDTILSIGCYENISNIYSCYQINEDGQQVIIPVYANTEIKSLPLEFLYPDKFLFFDFDNDKKIEILQRVNGSSSLRWGINMWEIDGNNIVFSNTIENG